MVEKLPPMPEHIDDLLRTGVTHDIDCFVRVVESDPGLCTELLHLANSDCYERSGKIETVRDAAESIGPEPLINLIGLTQAKNIVLKHFSRMEKLEEYFEHSADIRFAARRLALTGGMAFHQVQMYSAAGLIHDIGRLVILLASEKTSANLMGTDWQEMMSVVDEERQILGMNHCIVGSRLCRKWNFSRILEEGVLRHHTPIVNGDYSRPGALLFVAHFVSASDFTGEIVSRMLPCELLEPLNLDKEKFRRTRELYAKR